MSSKQENERLEQIRKNKNALESLITTKKLIDLGFVSESESPYKEVFTKDLHCGTGSKLVLETIDILPDVWETKITQGGNEIYLRDVKYTHELRFLYLGLTGENIQ